MRSVFYCGMLLIFLRLPLAEAIGTNSYQKMAFSSPLLSPTETVHLATSYLENEKRLDVRKYKLLDLHFRYHSRWTVGEEPYHGEWYLTFGLKQNAIIDSDLTVVIPNTKDPKIRINKW